MEIKGVALSQLGRHDGAKLTKRGLAAPEYAVRAMAPFIVHDVMPSHGKLDEMTVDRWWGVCEKVKLYAAASLRDAAGDGLAFPRTFGRGAVRF